MVFILRNFKSDFKSSRKNLETCLDELICGNFEIDRHLNFHRNWRAALGGTMAGLWYRAVVEDSFNQDEFDKIQKIGSLGSVIFNNVDDIIDNGYLADVEEQIVLVRDYMKIVNLGKMMIFGHSKLDELGLISRKVHDLISNSPEPKFYLDAYTHLGNAVIDQKKADGKNNTIGMQSSLYKSIEKDLEKTMGLYNFNRFSSDEINDLVLASRLGGYTMSVLTSMPYAFQFGLDLDLLKSSFYLGASLQINDDIMDFDKDKGSGQYTFMTNKNRGKSYLIKDFVETKDELYWKSLKLSNGNQDVKKMLKFGNYSINFLNVLTSAKLIKKVANPNFSFD